MIKKTHEMFVEEV